jgi:hypothetical protein
VGKAKIEVPGNFPMHMMVPLSQALKYSTHGEFSECYVNTNMMYERVAVTYLKHEFT